VSIDDAFLDRHESWVRAWLVLGPTLIGFYPATGLINPFWGSLFGFPLYAAARGHAVYEAHPPTELAAAFLWPLVVYAGMAWAAWRLLAWSSPWRRRLVLLWAASAFAVVPFYSLPHLFPGWPVYCACE
jgi:hypothetical protein